MHVALPSLSLLHVHDAVLVYVDNFENTISHKTPANLCLDDTHNSIVGEVAAYIRRFRYRDMDVRKGLSCISFSFITIMSFSSLFFSFPSSFFLHSSYLLLLHLIPASLFHLHPSLLFLLRSSPPSLLGL